METEELATVIVEVGVATGIVEVATGIVEVGAGATGRINKHRASISKNYNIC
jgi:hypothetical protein